MLASRKIVHPVLLDPTKAYREVQRVGVYPVATLADARGRVVWQGLTRLRGTFADACEAEIRKLLGLDETKDTGPALGDR